jgi:hypothetical protein
MTKHAKFFGFGVEEVAERFPASVEAAQLRGRGHGLGLRPSRYVGKHRGLEATNAHKPSRAERGAERRRIKKANDFGFGS